MATHLTLLLQQIITHLQTHGLEDISARDYLRLKELLEQLEKDGAIDVDG